MIFDAIGCEVPDYIQELFLCGSREEQNIVLAVKHDGKSLNEVCRQYELDQFFEYAGRRLDINDFSRPAWRITQIKWPTESENYIEFGFLYEKIVPNMTHTIPLVGYVSPFDSQGSGFIRLYPGDFNETKLKSVIMNFVNSYIAFNPNSAIYEKEIEKKTYEFLDMAKSFLDLSKVNKKD